MEPNTTPKKRGGPDFHKPECGCIACKARRRKAEAKPEPVGTGTGLIPPKDQLSDVLVTHKKTARGRVAAWVEMRATEPDITVGEAARRMGIVPATLHNMISIARREGWLRLEDPALRVAHEIIPKATDNMSDLLDAKNEKATLAVFNQIIAPAYRESIGISEQNNTIIALKIEMPPADQMPIIKGQIVGSGRTHKAKDGSDD